MPGFAHKASCLEGAAPCHLAGPDKAPGPRQAERPPARAEPSPHISVLRCCAVSRPTDRTGRAGAGSPERCRDRGRAFPRRGLPTAPGTASASPGRRDADRAANPVAVGPRPSGRAPHARASRSRQLRTAPGRRWPAPLVRLRIRSRRAFPRCRRPGPCSTPGASRPVPPSHEAKDRLGQVCRQPSVAGGSPRESPGQQVRSLPDRAAGLARPGDQAKRAQCCRLSV